MELEEADESIDPRVGFGFEDTHKSTCGSNAKAPRCSFGSVVLYAGAVLLHGTSYERYGLWTGGTMPINSVRDQRTVRRWQVAG